MAIFHNVSIRLVAAICVLLGAALSPGHAAGPVETSIFAVQGVEVDVTDTDASLAKNKALTLAQVLAFKKLAEQLGTPEVVETVATLEEKKILPYLKSLSIEEESISPGRYKGKLTVRFLPDKVKAFYSSFGIRLVTEQGPSFLVLPMWKTGSGTLLWEDNPWRRAWVNLRAEQSLVPIIVPLGDLDDSAIISAEDVLSGDEVKLEAIRRRYDVKAILVAYAEPVEDGGIKAQMIGDSPLGKITFDKVYTADTGLVDDSASLATQRFHKVMVDKYRSGAGKLAAAKEADGANGTQKRHTLAVAVPFAGPSEWNRMRSRILSAPGVVGLDVSSLGGDGAVVRLTISGELEDMQSRFLAAGLQLSRAGGNWVIQPL